MCLVTLNTFILSHADDGMPSYVDDLGDSDNLPKKLYKIKHVTNKIALSNSRKLHRAPRREIGEMEMFAAHRKKLLKNGNGQSKNSVRQAAKVPCNSFLQTVERDEDFEDRVVDNEDSDQLDDSQSGEDNVSDSMYSDAMVDRGKPLAKTKKLSTNRGRGRFMKAVDNPAIADSSNSLLNRVTDNINLGAVADNSNSGALADNSNSGADYKIEKGVEFSAPDFSNKNVNEDSLNEDSSDEHVEEDSSIKDMSSNVLEKGVDFSAPHFSNKNVNNVDSPDEHVEEGSAVKDMFSNVPDGSMDTLNLEDSSALALHSGDLSAESRDLSLEEGASRDLSAEEGASLRDLSVKEGTSRDLSLEEGARDRSAEGASRQKRGSDCATSTMCCGPPTPSAPLPRVRPPSGPKLIVIPAECTEEAPRCCANKPAPAPSGCRSDAEVGT